MGKINLTSNSIDVGIVTQNAPTMLDFYINTLGLTKEIEIPFPGLGTVNKLNYADLIFFSINFGISSSVIISSSLAFFG